MLIAGAGAFEPNVCSSTVTSSVEILKAGLTLGTTFKVDQADLVSGGSVIGDNTTSNDTIVIAERWL